MPDNSPLDGRLFIPHPIPGWRLFKVEQNRARSLYWSCPEGFFELDDHNWHTAVCRKSMGAPILPWVNNPPPEHEAPHRDCSCGFYAWKTRLGVLFDLISAYEPRFMPEIVAKVEVAGRAVPHERGWRARNIRIVRWWPSWVWLVRVGRLVKPEWLPPDSVNWYNLLRRQLGRLTTQDNLCQHCTFAGCWGVRTHGEVCARCNQHTATTEGCWYDRWRKLREVSK